MFLKKRLSDQKEIETIASKNNVFNQKDKCSEFIAFPKLISGVELVAFKRAIIKN